MQVYTSNGEIADDDDILSCLISIVSNSEPSAESVGIFTTEHRDVWGSVYQDLTKGNYFSHLLFIFLFNQLIVSTEMNYFRFG